VKYVLGSPAAVQVTSETVAVPEKLGEHAQQQAVVDDDRSPGTDALRNGDLGWSPT
jgi:hypothetical protein